MLKKLLLALAVIALPVLAQTCPDATADVCINFLLSGNGASGVFNNTQAGIVTWQVSYAPVSTVTALSLSFQSAAVGATITTPGTFGTFAGTVVNGLEPNTSTAGAITTYKNVNVATPFVRVNLSGYMGSGNIVGVIKGWTAGHTGGNGVSVGIPSPPNGSVQFNNSRAFGGDANLIWNASPTATGMTGLQIGLVEPNLSSFDGAGNTISAINQGGTTTAQANFLHAGPAPATYFSFYSSAGTVVAPTNVTANATTFGLDVWSRQGGTYNLGHFLGANTNAANNGGNWQLTASDTTPRAFTALVMSSGVLGIVTGNSLVPANGISEVSTTELEINNGTKVSNGGSLITVDISALKLPNNIANQILQAKVTAAAAAPGAGFCNLIWRAGTNAGTGKLVANCGTSATEVTIADNVGAGF